MFVDGPLDRIMENLIVSHVHTTGIVSKPVTYGYNQIVEGFQTILALKDGLVDLDPIVQIAVEAPVRYSFSVEMEDLRNALKKKNLEIPFQWEDYLVQLETVKLGCLERMKSQCFKEGAKLDLFQIKDINLEINLDLEALRLQNERVTQEIIDRYFLGKSESYYLLEKLSDLNDWLDIESLKSDIPEPVAFILPQIHSRIVKFHQERQKAYSCLKKHVLNQCLTQNVKGHALIHNDRRMVVFGSEEKWFNFIVETPGISQQFIDALNFDDGIGVSAMKKLHMKLSENDPIIPEWLYNSDPKVFSDNFIALHLEAVTKRNERKTENYPSQQPERPTKKANQGDDLRSDGDDGVKPQENQPQEIPEIETKAAAQVSSDSTIDRILSSPMDSWTIEDTYEWLRTIIPTEAAEKLKAEKFSGSVLPELAKQLQILGSSLRTDLELSMSDVLKLNAAIRDYRPRPKTSLKVVIQKINPWYFTQVQEDENWQLRGGETAPYFSFLLNGFGQSNLVWDLFQTLFAPMKNSKSLRISKVYAICNPGLYTAFDQYKHGLNEKFRVNSQLFLSYDWRNASDVAQKQHVCDNFQKYKDKFPWNVGAPVSVIPMLHGTTRETSWHIARTGLTTVSEVDDGYYGKGIYITSDCLYARQYSASSCAGQQSSKLCLVLSVVIPGNPFFVTEHHEGVNSLRGKALISRGYQSHYCNVYAMGDESKKRRIGHVWDDSVPGEDAADELVVFQDAQVLPLFIIHCK